MTNRVTVDMEMPASSQEGSQVEATGNARTSAKSSSLRPGVWGQQTTKFAELPSSSSIVQHMTPHRVCQQNVGNGKGNVTNGGKGWEKPYQSLLSTQESGGDPERRLEGELCRLTN